MLSAERAKRRKKRASLDSSFLSSLRPTSLSRRRRRNLLRILLLPAPLPRSLLWLGLYLASLLQRIKYLLLTLLLPISFRRTNPTRPQHQVYFPLLEVFFLRTNPTRLYHQVFFALRQVFSPLLQVIFLRMIPTRTDQVFDLSSKSFFYV